MTKQPKVLCPFCKHIDRSGRPTASLNIGKKLGYCFHCKMSLFGNVFDKALADSHYTEEDVQVHDEEVKPLTDELWKPLVGFDYMSKKALAYLNGRGVTQEIIDKYHISLGLGKLLGRVVFPIVNSGELESYQARTFTGQEPKYLTPSVEEVPVGRNGVVAFLDDVKCGHTVYICEGILTAIGHKLLTGLPTVAILGHSIGDTQLVRILMKNPSKVSFIYDEDVTLKERFRDMNKCRSFGCDASIYRTVEGDCWDIYTTGKGRIEKLY